MQAEAPPTPVILMKPSQAAQACGMSRSTFDKLTAAGRIGPRPVEIGKLRLWPRVELEAWAAAGCPGRVEWLAHERSPKPRLVAG